MSKGSRPYEVGLIESLRAHPDEDAEYLAGALEDMAEPHGRDIFLTALRRVAEARGIGELADSAGVTRQSLYRALKPGGNPTLSTLFGVLNALGMRLTIDVSTDEVQPAMSEAVQTAVIHAAASFKRDLDAAFARIKGSSEQFTLYTKVSEAANLQAEHDQPAHFQYATVVRKAASSQATPKSKRGATGSSPRKATTAAR